MESTRSRTSPLVLAALPLLALAACSDAPGSRQESTLPAVEPGTLAPRECGVSLAVAADCYWLAVPESRRGLSSRQIRLPVMVLRSSSANPGREPLVIPEGGPGYSGLDSARYFSGTALVADGDVVLTDQRGTGLAEPSLDCPEKEEAVERNLGRAADFATELADFRAALTTCRARLVAAGVDLDAYDTEENAADFVALRKALAIERWSVLGVSYGSRVALELMRRDPEGTRAVILDSVYPPGAGGIQQWSYKSERAFTALIDGCAADAGCNARYPDLRSRLDQVVANADREPLSLDVALLDGRTVHVELTGPDLASGLFSALYDSSLIPLLPGIISDLAAGDPAIIPAVAQRGIPFINDIFEGMNQSVDCADNAGLTDDDGRRLLENPGRTAALLGYASDVFCDLWDVEPARPGFQDPVVSDIPTLVLAGSYDPATPPRDSRAAADALEHATFIEIPGVGHGVWDSSSCATSIALAFLADPEAAVDASCARAITGPDFS